MVENTYAPLKIVSDLLPTIFTQAINYSLQLLVLAVVIIAFASSGGKAGRAFRSVLVAFCLSALCGLFQVGRLIGLLGNSDKTPVVADSIYSAQLAAILQWVAFAVGLACLTWHKWQNVPTPSLADQVEELARTGKLLTRPVSEDEAAAIQARLEKRSHK